MWTQTDKQNNYHAYFLTSDDFCPFDWDINQTRLYGRKTTIGGGGGGVAVPGGGIVPYARGGVVARKFRIKRLKETILQKSKTLTVLEKDGIYFLFINTSLRTTLNDCFMGKKICFPPWTWNQKLQFTSLSTLRRERSRVLQGLDRTYYFLIPERVCPSRRNNHVS